MPCDHPQTHQNAIIMRNAALSAHFHPPTPSLAPAQPRQRSTRRVSLSTTSAAVAATGAGRESAAPSGAGASAAASVPAVANAKPGIAATSSATAAAKLQRRPAMLEVQGLAAEVAATRGHRTQKGGVRIDASTRGHQQHQQQHPPDGPQHVERQQHQHSGLLQHLNQQHQQHADVPLLQHLEPPPPPPQQQQEEPLILRGVTLSIGEGEVHALMGRNGSGKSTLAKVLVGHPGYTVMAGSASFRGQDLLSLKPEQRARMGLFLSFQSGVEIPGVAMVDFLTMGTNAMRRARGQPELDPLEAYAFISCKVEALGMDPSFLSRSVNVGFSGGEKKLGEMLQLACLEPDLAILDEIDSGLDIDALHAVARAVQGLRAQRPRMSWLIITHYKRLLDLVPPDWVHIMDGGRLVASDHSMRLVEQLEREGYRSGVLRPMAM